MAALPEGFRFVPLSPDDAPELQRFACRAYGKPWTAEIEATIRNDLAAALALGTSAVALRDDGGLRGLVAWDADHLDPSIRWIGVLAVALGSQGRGHARALKREAMRIAAIDGIRILRSNVHWENEPMLHINRSLGALVEPIPGDDDYWRCLLPVGPGR